jgi:hypothetical protein
MNWNGKFVKNYFFSLNWEVNGSLTKKWHRVDIPEEKYYWQEEELNSIQRAGGAQEIEMVDFDYKQYVRKAQWCSFCKKYKINSYVNKEVVWCELASSPNKRVAVDRILLCRAEYEI